MHSDGKVGIGTDAPAAKLHVESASGSITPSVHADELLVEGSGNSGITIGSGTSGLGSLRFADSGGDSQGQVGYDHSGNHMSFFTDDSESMRVDSSGNVLIGRTSSGITGNGHTIRGSDSAIFSRDSSGETMQVCRNDSTGDLIRFRRNGTICGEIVNNGATSVAYQTSSDYRLKENVVTDWDATTRLKQLKPSRFNFIAEPERVVDGFLAHEAQTVVPECASGEKDEVDENGEPVMQGIDQSKLVPLLTKALQEAVAKIETLEAKVTALESK